MAKNKKRVQRKQTQSKNIVSSELFIPNHSGDHSAGTTGTPVNDLDIANKKYVDDNAGASPLTTKGDVFTFSTIDARLAIGTNDDVLTADSAQGTGLKWATPASPTPGGSDTQVQFNDAGSFGGDSALVWDNTNKRVGIGATPLAPLHIKADSNKKVLRLQENAGAGEFFDIQVATNGNLEFVDDVGVKKLILLDAANEIQVPVKMSSLSDIQTTINWSGNGQIFIKCTDVEFVRFKNASQDITIFNETGVDIDFRIETDTEPNFFFIDGADNTLRIGDMDTNYIQFAVDGELTLVGTARVKKDIAIPLDGIGRGATAPTITRLANTYGYAFTIGDDGYMMFEIPTDWDTTTDIEIAIHIYTDEAFSVNSAETQWQGLYSVIPEDGSEAVDGATHTGTLDSGDVNIPATAKGLQEITIGTIPAADIAVHDVVAIKLSRVALDAGNNPSPEPVLIQAEYEYTANKLGEAT